MSWFGSSFITLASLTGVVIALRLFLGWQVFGNNRTRYDFAHGIRSLLILRENGGYLDIRHRESQSRLRVYRESGGDDDAKVVVWVPLKIAFDRPAAEIVDLLGRHGHEAAIVPGPEPSISIPVEVTDIWPEHSGARAARVVHLVLDAWGLGPDQRFNLRIRGAGSTRSFRRFRVNKEIA